MKKLIYLIVSILFSTHLFAQSTDWTEIKGMETLPQYPLFAVENNDLYYAVSNIETDKITVCKLVNNKWTQIGSDFTVNKQSSVTSLVVSKGVPYVLLGVNNGNIMSVSLFKFDGTSWKTLGNQFISDDYMIASNMVVYNDVPSIFVIESKYQSKATVYSFDKNQWKVLGTPGFSKSQYFDSQMAMLGDKIVVVYKETAGNKRCAKMFNGSKWESFEGGDAFSDGKRFMFIVSSYPNQLIVSYKDAVAGNSPKCFKYENNKWKDINNSELSTIKTRFMQAVNYKGKTILLYEDATKGNTVFMKENTNGTWSNARSFSDTPYTYCQTFVNEAGLYLYVNDADNKFKLFKYNK